VDTVEAFLSKNPFLDECLTGLKTGFQSNNTENRF
jgi:hypothetical protein